MIFYFRLPIYELKPFTLFAQNDTASCFTMPILSGAKDLDFAWGNAIFVEELNFIFPSINFRRLD